MVSFRIFKITGAVCLILVCLCSGVYLGGQIERKNHAAIQSKMECAQTIAVVNLDEGIIQNNSSVYYSNDFLIYPSTNFIATGLEDARQGIYQGRYGACLIVPAAFSRSIASVNGVPQKSTLEYMVNPNLEEEVKHEVVSQIQQFQLILNTNISYVYISSILDEFHSTQDSAVTVLKNDKNELERISEIEADQLLQKLIVSPMEQIDYRLSDLDVRGEFSEGGDLLDQLGGGILSALGEGKEEFWRVKQQNAIFKTASKDLFDLLETIEPGRTSTGELVYQNGMEELEQRIDIFHTDLSSKREEISRRLFQNGEEYRREGEEYLNVRLIQLQENANLQLMNQIDLMQNHVDEALEQIQLENHRIIQNQLLMMQAERDGEYHEIQTYIDQCLEEVVIELKAVYEEDANQQLQEILEEIGYGATPSQAMPSEEYPMATPVEATPSQAYQITLATASEAEINLDHSGLTGLEISGRNFPLKQVVGGLMDNHNQETDIWITLQAASILFPDNFVILPLLHWENYQVLAGEVQELYYISSDEIKTVLQEKVIGEIVRQNEVQKIEIEAMTGSLNVHLNDYERSVEYFDPYLYVHLDEISRIVSKVRQVIGLIDQSVYEKTDQDRGFVHMVYEIIDKNNDALQTDMEQTNEQTLKNITGMVQALKTYRLETNQENTELLEAFTRKLSHTRLGSVGNKQVYDFIVNPISMIPKETKKQSGFQLDSDLKKYLFPGILIITATGGTSVISVFFSVLQQRRQRISLEIAEKTQLNNR